jgi:hypothetical protein
MKAICDPPIRNWRGKWSKPPVILCNQKGGGLCPQRRPIWTNTIVPMCAHLYGMSNKVLYSFYPFQRWILTENSCSWVCCMDTRHWLAIPKKRNITCMLISEAYRYWRVESDSRRAGWIRKWRNRITTLTQRLSLSQGYMFLTGFDPITFRSSVWRSPNWATRTGGLRSEVWNLTQIS